VPFEAVAFDREADSRPREVEAEAFDAVLHDVGRDVIRTEETGGLHFES